jgi:hypothetical protein
MGPLSALAKRLAFHDTFLAQLTEGFEPSDWLHRIGEANHAQWLVGHLASTRRWALRLLEVSADEEAWEKHFRPNCPPTPQGDDIAPEMLLEAFVKNGEVLREHIAAMSTEATEAEFRSFPDGSHTVGGGMHFLHFHESYHIGQIGLLRRAVGKPGLA